jgi:fatty acid-binding protein DegV
MSIKVVTDSTADLPPQLAQEMGIVVVPAYVKFGPDVYRDRVDIGVPGGGRHHLATHLEQAERHL